MDSAVLTVEEIIAILKDPTSAPQIEVNPNVWVGGKGAIQLDKVKTQKVSGLVALDRSGYQTPWYCVIRHEDAVPLAIKRVERYISSWGERGAFARPCPVVPRHGFVDSRPVKNADDLLAAIREAKTEDEDAELLLMPFLDARFSAIWTPSSVSLGPGNDGATSGRDAIQIPQQSDYMRYHKGEMLKSARVGDDQDPYVEVVVTMKKWEPDNYERSLGTHQVHLVQLRAGPKVGHQTDYVPTKADVKRVIKVNGESLLEWEKLVAGFGPGDVVWHPGGTLASHYSVHCMLNKVPVLISHEPVVGDTLVPTDKLEDYDMASCVRGLMAGMSVRIGNKVEVDRAARKTIPVFIDEVGEGVRIAHLCWATHNAGFLRGTHSYQLGYVSAIMHRFGSAACIGEARHATAGGPRRERSQIYKTAFSNPFQARKKLQSALWLFQNYPWGGGYGGAAWAECTKSVLDLDMAILKLLKGDSKVEDLAEALNRSVDKAHNHGWWLNKWAETSLFQQAANGDPRVLFQALPSIWQSEQMKALEVPKLISDGIAGLDDLGKYEPSSDVKAVVEQRARAAEKKVEALKAVQVKTYDNMTKPKSPAVEAMGKLAHSLIHVQWKTAKQVAGTRDIKYFTINHMPTELCECCKTVVNLCNSGYGSQFYTTESMSGSHNSYMPFYCDAEGGVFFSKESLAQAASLAGMTNIHANDEHGCKIIDTQPTPVGFGFADSTPNQFMWIKSPMDQATEAVDAIKAVTGEGALATFKDFLAALPATPSDTDDTDEDYDDGDDDDEGEMTPEVEAVVLEKTPELLGEEDDLWEIMDKEA